MQTPNPRYIIADHIRAACFIIADGVEPSAKQRGYILRRLIRRSLSASLKLKIDISDPNYISDLVDAVVGIYDGVYDEIAENRIKIIEVIGGESKKYLNAIVVGKREWAKLLKNNVMDSFELSRKTWDLYQTFGVPIEVSEDVLQENNFSFDSLELKNLIHEHQKLSQTTSAGQFKSGLGGDSLKTRKLHTATHILHQVLRDVLGVQVCQKGSAITDEKARFDFTFDNKVEESTLKTIQDRVQAVIDSSAEMQMNEMTQHEARELGAIGLFGEKYGDKVTVYSMTDDTGHVFSREFCGGPHIQNTKEIGVFTILKLKSIGQGLKRIEFDVI